MKGPAKKKSGTKTSRRAVVDIGSNSVRLVIYDGPRRAPIAICNEKALCGLGRDISADGSLASGAVQDALATLTRFRRILDEHGAPPTQAIATAAVRDARDGANFVSAVNALGFEVETITGGMEAELAAFGVVSFEPGATGLAGDMGGGSLELVALKKGEMVSSTSLPVGPFNVMRFAPEDGAAAQDYIDAELDKVDFLNAGDQPTLYAVGGAWRAIARIDMRIRNYPLSVLHHYELTSGEAIAVCDLIARQSRRSLEEIPGIPRRRIDTLPYAAIVMKSCLLRMKAQKVVVSAGGVREGILYKDLSEKARREDPLIEGAKFYASRLAPQSDVGEAAFKMLEPLFAAQNGTTIRLRRAAALMMDIGAYFHPDLRAIHAFDTALRAPFAGVSHQERVWLALALYCRHRGRASAPLEDPAVALLSWEEQQSAVQYGLALRFAAAFAPKLSAPLKDCRLEFEPGRLVFRGPADREDLMGETPRKRLDALAAGFEAQAIEIYES